MRPRTHTGQETRTWAPGNMVGSSHSQHQEARKLGYIPAQVPAAEIEAMVPITHESMALAVVTRMTCAISVPKPLEMPQVPNRSF